MKPQTKTIAAQKPGRRVIFTVGHSTHPIDEFIALLQAHGIRNLVDVRTIPMSRHNPQFNSEALRASLVRVGIRYRHLKKLGGLRRAKRDSINLGWRNTSFRGYADYMATAEFAAGLAALEKIAGERGDAASAGARGTTAIMCAEAVPWRCHRSLIADALIKAGWLVRDITSKTTVKRHKLTPFLKMRKGEIIYPES